MDQEQARALLREERHRLERLRTSVDADHDRVAPADEVSEDLADGADRRTLEETDEAVARQLASRLEALQRAEDRLAAGTYGRSVLSGRPIPDERLEAVPLAELTVDEEAAQERTDRPVVEAVERAADGEDRAAVFPTGWTPRGSARRASRSRSWTTRRCRTTSSWRTTRRPSTSRHPSATRRCRRCPTAFPRTTRGAASPSRTAVATGTSKAARSSRNETCPARSAGGW
jgi:DnaK suppressor protein